VGPKICKLNYGNILLTVLVNLKIFWLIVLFNFTLPSSSNVCHFPLLFHGLCVCVRACSQLSGLY